MGIKLATSGAEHYFPGLGFAVGFSSVAVALIGFVPTGVMAQTVEQPRGSLTTVDIDVTELPTVQEEVLDVYFSQDKTFFANQRFPRTLVPIFGIIENDIGGDGRRIYNLYRELFDQQTAGVPIRVADAPNPFTGSLATTPLYVEDPIPPAPIPSFVPPPPGRSVVPVPSPRETQESIPALW
ncbi:MAG TPA: hypothetical protein V6C65_38295 [Allocoleopsis sp.]